MANNTGGTTGVTTTRTTTKSAGTTVTINGGNGADTITASSEYVKVSAKSSDKFVIIAGNGDDTVYGSDYAELIWGDSNNTNDTSANGFDTLNGGGGSDEIHGGNGSDIISGDAGADLLYGERGGDIFKIKVVSDSAATSTGAWSFSTGDWIKDFRKIDGDKLDLGGLNSAQPLLQLSAAGARPYGVWIGTDTSGNKIVYADINGVSLADVAVKVTGDIDLGSIINVD